MAGGLQIFATAVLLANSCQALIAPNLQALNVKDASLPPSKRADSDLTGYLGAFFLGDEPDVYFYLSQGNNAISFSALNGGEPILVPTVGTGGVRDPAIVTGGGSEAGNKWYIVGTDLDISKVSNNGQEQGWSRSGGLIMVDARQLGMHLSGMVRGAFLCGRAPT